MELSGFWRKPTTQSERECRTLVAAGKIASWRTQTMTPVHLPIAPQRIENTNQLEECLSEPTTQAIDTLRELDGDLILLGVAGKMGPTLARMARVASERAGVRRRIIGVARFTESRLESQLQSHGIETIRCDLLDPVQLARLPDVPNVIAMFGMKFGSSSQEARTDRKSVV